MKRKSGLTDKQWLLIARNSSTLHNEDLPEQDLQSPPLTKWHYIALGWVLGMITMAVICVVGK